MPAPVSRSVPAASLIDPPVALPPVFVATVIVPPDPVVMLRSAAPPVPPTAVFTFTRTAFAAARPRQSEAASS